MDPTISPKTAMYINIALSVCVALAGAGALFTDIVGEIITKPVVAGFGLGALVLGAVNASLHAFSAREAGPLARYLAPKKPVEIDTIDIPGQDKGGAKCSN